MCLVSDADPIRYGCAAPHQSFQHFIELLEQDVWLNSKTHSRMEKIWLQSGVDAQKWEAIPISARQIMVQLMAVHYADWFGVAGAGCPFDPQERWEWFSIMPEATCPCDMLIMMPSRLATELNGKSGLFTRLCTTSERYMQLFDCEIRHCCISPDAGTSGFNCFDRGNHVDSGPYPAKEPRQSASGDGARMYLVTPETAVVPAVTAAHYDSTRA